MGWVTSPASEGIIPEYVRRNLTAVHEAADMRHPEEWYPNARGLRRKVIMHVGPTNSGKTHNALRALAAARIGVYAGPLRLLAHEIYYRLNKGQIVPSGADPDEPPESRVRECNLITGEEQKIVSADAKLVSCTVEMLNLTTRWDVAVVDEIQMITDSDRGGAWCSAVLGLCVKELHLCGEASVVPLIQEMLKDTGDEIIINRYDRLSPLTVAPRSLCGDLSQIGPGDCIVTFSRARIFALKKEIEDRSGMRCAVAYGRLPPEVRTEQAALFNDPKSGYDVLVASDAVGMGLNLKIKRIIFETVHKWDGHMDIPLSTSQIKQIAGRAGRYGLHGDDSLGGVVTTLQERDLDIVRGALAIKVIPPLKRAILPVTLQTHSTLEESVVAPAKFKDIYEIKEYVSSLQPHYALQDLSHLLASAEFVDKYCAGLSLAERLLIMNAPVALKDPLCQDAMVRFVRMYRHQRTVDVLRGIHGMGLTEALDSVQAVQDLHDLQALQGQSQSQPMSSPQTLGLLESLHKILVSYLWFSFRAPLSFNQREVAGEMKGKTERAIDWCLQGLQDPRLAEWRGELRRVKGAAGGASGEDKRVLETPPTRQSLQLQAVV
ncbi:P-loop containing nucleoside triphosphate hydrolase protein [Rickenella mellea]|uniref:RNA helicase n=1 Tax=Rickenella mellea TaxID=50990 RepID=A0A4Y7PSZ0_9AGAM|nr:P-loop containing nucleoside triphosphate hydrolase protein [Rickenella mellea]